MNRPVVPTLFQRLLGASYYGLPPSVRALHAIRGSAVYAGCTDIARGRNPLARLCAALAGLPPTRADVRTVVRFEASPSAETWHRDFGGRPMRSRLRAAGPRLEERLGPMRFRFAVHAHGGAIHWRVHAAHLFGVLPLPVRWFRGVRCREHAHEGRYAFEVEAALPLAGRVIRYAGWLEPVAPGDEADATVAARS